MLPGRDCSRNELLNSGSGTDILRFEAAEGYWMLENDGGISISS